MPVYRRVITYFRPYLGRTALGVSLLFVGTAFNLLKPWPFKYVIDSVLAPSDGRVSPPDLLQALLDQMTPVAVIGALCIALVAIHLLAGVINLVTNAIFVRVGLQALLKLRTDLYSYLHSLPLKFHDTRRSSDSSFRVAYDSQSIQTIYNRGFTTILGASITIFGALGILFWMDWLLTLVALVVLPLNVLTIRYYAAKVRRESTTIQERESGVLAVAQEGLSAVRMVQAFGREQYEVSQFHSHASESLQANLALTMTTMKSALVVSALMAAGTALLYYVGSLHVLDGSLAIGELIVFASYLAMLYQPIEQLAYTAWALETAAAGAQRCFEILDRPDDLPDHPDATSLKSASGRIVFEDVAFGYVGRRQILSGVNVEIEPGEAVALVGGTGAGKSTFLSLIPRFYEPETGQILVDGYDITRITKQSLRSQISIVLQDTLLFSTSVKENIAYGRPEATDEEIYEAARRAQAHDFISALENGYDSQVGERGSHLSVGQRQRIGIARAFLKDAPILLLDEPTSALDPATEREIMSTLETLMAGRTTLIVTHRISTIHKLSKIIVVDRGRVAEVGSGKDLVAHGGIYARLYAAAHGAEAAFSD